MKAIGNPHPYACFACRKSFKRPQFHGSTNRFMVGEQKRGQDEEAREFEEDRDYKCPDCGGATHYMGIDFKAPKKTDAKGWKAVREYIESGGTYYRNR